MRAVLFPDPDAGRFFAHDSPYTYFAKPDLHLGEISLECSRAGAAAATLWLRLQLITQPSLCKDLFCLATQADVADGSGLPAMIGRLEPGTRLSRPTSPRRTGNCWRC
ncbi:hypothetical protein SAMN05216215_110215 [Saccharopolyspora shandongensis]|uniref:Uncharacterized protein n=1 Tax=Saccharopolyspora shandongensis TaxID=418495 RepID=A0A1H3U2I2_9PSEU|nr:hypothetical protein [Saccharopolyspora shandongensis]SDZ56552.1 hypothetical protein SAMN05216215_110215 [Saccharopolyspora shandongensis]